MRAVIAALTCAVGILLVNCGDSRKDNNTNLHSGQSAESSQPGENEGVPDGTSAEPNMHELASMEWEEAEQFLGQIKKVVSERNTEVAFSLFLMPLESTTESGSVRIEDLEIFQAHYDRIFTREVIGVIESQEMNEVIDSWKGVGLGRGELWFTNICVEPLEGQEGGCRAHEQKIIKVGSWVGAISYEPTAGEGG